MILLRERHGSPRAMVSDELKRERASKERQAGRQAIDIRAPLPERGVDEAIARCGLAGEKVSARFSDRARALGRRSLDSEGSAELGELIEVCLRLHSRGSISWPRPIAIVAIGDGARMDAGVVLLDNRCPSQQPRRWGQSAALT